MRLSDDLEARDRALRGTTASTPPYRVGGTANHGGPSIPIVGAFRRRAGVGYGGPRTTGASELMPAPPAPAAP